MIATINVNPHTHTRMHTHMHTHKHTHTSTLTHTHKHTYTHTRERESENMLWDCSHWKTLAMHVLKTLFQQLNSLGDVAEFAEDFSTRHVIDGQH